MLLKLRGSYWWQSELVQPYLSLNSTLLAPQSMELDWCTNLPILQLLLLSSILSSNWYASSILQFPFNNVEMELWKESKNAMEELVAQPIALSKQTDMSADLQLENVMSPRLAMAPALSAPLID